MSLTEYPRLGEQVYSETLPGGLKVLVVPKKGFSQKSAYFATNYGAMHTHFRLEGQEYTAPAGVAHFLEHKMFELPDRDVSGEFAAMGAFVNAFTAYDQTAYFFQCTENFAPCLRLLLEFVSTPYFPAESVDREQGIIGQEIGMNEDSPDSRVYENLMEAMYDHHPIRVPILGTRETIAKITPEILTACHRAFYTPGNMVLCVAGDVEPEEVIAIANEVLGTEKRPVGEKIPPEAEDLRCPQSEVREQQDVSNPQFQLGFKCAPVEPGEGQRRQELIASLAIEALLGESSPLYRRLYEEGIINGTFGGGYETMDGCAMVLVGGESREPEKIREAILQEAADLYQRGMDETAFQRMKRSLMGRLVRGLDDMDGTCYRVCNSTMQGYSYFAFPETVASIEATELTDFLARSITRAGCCLSVIAPRDEKKED